jgi:AAA domain
MQRIFGCSERKGNTGKTTTVVSVAAALAANTPSVLMVHEDLQGGRLVHQPDDVVVHALMDDGGFLEGVVAAVDTGPTVNIAHVAYRRRHNQR